MGQLSWTRLQGSGEALLADDDPDPQALAAFAVAARQLADALSPAELRALGELFGAVEAHGRRAAERVREQLAGTGKGRRALAGYGSLRSFKRCQRASAWR